MNRTTTCFYCQRPGTITPWTFTEPPVDWHMHRCGTLLYVDPQTGEIVKTLRAPACHDFEALNEDLRVLTVQVRNLVAQRDGDMIDDTDLPF